MWYSICFRSFTLRATYRACMGHQTAEAILLKFIDEIFHNEEIAERIISNVQKVASNWIEKQNTKYNEYTYTALMGAIGDIYGIRSGNRNISELDHTAISNIYLVVSHLFDFIKCSHGKSSKKENISLLTERIFSSIKVEDSKAKNELKITKKSLPYVTHKLGDSEKFAISEQTFSFECENSIIDVDEDIEEIISVFDQEDDSEKSNIPNMISLLPRLFPDYHRLYNNFIFDEFLYAFFVVHTINYFRNRIDYIHDDNKLNIFLGLQKAIADKLLYFYETKLAEYNGDYAKTTVWMRKIFSLNTHLPHEAQSKQANIRVVVQQYFKKLGVNKSRSFRTIAGTILINRVRILEKYIVHNVTRDIENDNFGDACEYNSVYEILCELDKCENKKELVDKSMQLIQKIDRFNHLFHRVYTHLMPIFRGRMDVLWKLMSENLKDNRELMEILNQMNEDVKIVYALMIFYVVPVVYAHPGRYKNIPEILSWYLRNRTIAYNEI